MTVKRVQGDIFLDRIDEIIKEIDRAELQVGWFESAKYPNKTETPVAYVASVQEFGNPQKGIPPRPFMRPTLAANGKAWLQYFAQESPKILAAQTTPEAVLDVVGQLASGKIREAITKIHTPPLSEKTIKARLRIRKDQQTVGALDKPLVFEGVLLNTLTYNVTGG